MKIHLSLINTLKSEEMVVYVLEIFKNIPWKSIALTDFHEIRQLSLYEFSYRKVSSVFIVMAITYVILLKYLRDKPHFTATFCDDRNILRNLMKCVQQLSYSIKTHN